MGIALHRVVHGEQRFSYTRPVVDGDVLTATLTVDSLRQIGGADILGTRSEVVDADGNHVVTAHAVLVAQGRTRMNAMPRSASPCRPQTYTVTRADLVRYAGASGD